MDTVVTKETVNNNVLRYERIEDYSVLSNFCCGIKDMDRYIHNNLEEKLRENCDIFSYYVFDKEEVVGIFALREGELKLRRKGKTERFNSIEIEYLAVREDVRNNGYGTQIIQKIKRNCRKRLRRH